MSAAGRRRRAGGERTRRIGVERRVGGLVRWQGGPRRPGGTRWGLWTLFVLAAVLLTLALIAARTAGWLHWGALWMLAPAGVMLAVLGAGAIALARRGLAWLAG